MTSSVDAQLSEELLETFLVLFAEVTKRTSTYYPYSEKITKLDIYKDIKALKPKEKRFFIFFLLDMTKKMVYCGKMNKKI